MEDGQTPFANWVKTNASTANMLSIIMLLFAAWAAVEIVTNVTGNEIPPVTGMETNSDPDDAQRTNNGAIIGLVAVAGTLGLVLQLLLPRKESEDVVESMPEEDDDIGFSFARLLGSQYRPDGNCRPPPPPEASITCILHVRHVCHDTAQRLSWLKRLALELSVRALRDGRAAADPDAEVAEPAHAEHAQDQAVWMVAGTKRQLRTRRPAGTKGARRKRPAGFPACRGVA